MANEYEFHYVPAEGKLPGLQFQRQTEDAINDLGNRVILGAEADAAEALEKANTAISDSAEALETANNADTKAEEAIEAVNAMGNTHFLGVNSTDTSDINYDGDGATGENAIAIGVTASATTAYSIAVGTAADATGNNRAIAIGTQASATGSTSIAIGNSSRASTSGSVIIGYNSLVDEVWGGDAIVILGNSSEGSGDNSIVIGNQSSTGEENTVAIGHNAIAVTANSVALGSGSGVSGYEDAVISVGRMADWADSGNEEYKRRIVHVEDGVDDSDAATVGQVNTAIGQAYTAGNGLELTNGEFSVKAETDKGIDVSSNGVSVKVETNKGLDVGSNGLSVKIESNKGIEVSSNGLAVKAGNHIMLTSNGVNVDNTGTVTSGNTKLITGGAVFGSVVPIQENAGYHNSIFRGKNLGDTLTAAQSAAIQANTFDDLFVGDYWEKTIQFTYYSAATDLTAVTGKTYYADTAGTALEEQPAEGTDISEAKYCIANNVNALFRFRIADFNYYYNVGDTSFTTPHIVVVPDTILYSAQIHITNTGGYVSGAANTTEGGYIATDLFKGLVAAEDAFIAMFGASHIPSHRVLLPTTCTGGKYTSWGWESRKVDILTEQQVYGARIWGAPANNGYSVAAQKTQLSLFRLDPVSINNRQYYWLQDVSSSADFCGVGAGGNAGINGASVSFGVRPLSLVI